MGKCQFELGQTVAMRSGGPSMTVASIKTQPYEIYHCTWFDADGKYNSCEFDIHELTDTEKRIGFQRGITNDNRPK